MPKPLGPQPDEKPVHEQVRDLMRKAHMDRMAPVGIVFSQKGYEKAVGQSVPGMRAFTGETDQSHVATRYLGLPFTVSTSLTQGDVLLDLVPGGSAEAKAARTGRSAAVTLSTRLAELEAGGKLGLTTMTLIGGKLSVAQISDLVVAWADANPLGPLSEALRNAVTLHGRFE